MMLLLRASLLCTLALFSPSCRGYEIREHTLAEIAAGEPHYYSYPVRPSDTIIVALLSDEGDADLFVSTSVRKPSCEDYNYTSSSCGLDLVVVPAGGHSKVFIGVYGHVRYQSTAYRLYILAPSEEDILRYQVWDWDPETSSRRLLIDIDPLLMANDPALHLLLRPLMKGQDQEAGLLGSEEQSTLSTILEWTGYILLKTLQIAVEILL